MQKILIAGVGNVLRGDDGFGVEVARRLALRRDLLPHAKVMETGIGGMSLVQELMQGYDALLLLDAYTKQGGKPGQLYMLDPVMPDLSQLDAHALRDYFADTHYTSPMRVLSFAAHTGHLPGVVRILGCEPEAAEEMRIGLSPAVSNAVEVALTMVVEWIEAHQDMSL